MKLMNLNAPDDVNHKTVSSTLRKITIYTDFIELEVNNGVANVDAERLENGKDEIVRNKEFVLIRVRATLSRRDRKLAFVDTHGYPVASTEQLNRVLVKNVAMAYRWRTSIEKEQYNSIRALAKAEKCSEKYVRKILPLAYLAPDIIESILEGQQPPKLDLQNFTSRTLPHSWDAQRKLLGYTA
jgi:site-specific DNA recombinase